MIDDQQENLYYAQEEYATCRVFMLKATEKPFEDAFAVNPQAQVSRLFQNINEQLETNSPKLKAGSTDVFLAIQSSVLQQIKTMKLKEKMTQAGVSIQSMVDPRPERPYYY